MEERKVVRVAVIDDAREDMDLTVRVAEQFFKNKGITYEVVAFTDPAALLEEIQYREVFDIFLLDVNMEKMDGRKLAKEIQLKCIHPLMIFITNYCEYALEGYEYNIYRYIIKKDTEEKLPRALESCVERLEARRKNEQYVEINGIRKLETIKFSDIFYVMKEKKYVIIVHRDGKSEMRMTMKDFYEKLDPGLFVYCDKSYVVNLMHINSVRDNIIDMSNNDKIPVSIPRLKSVLEQLRKYRRERDI